MSTLTPKRPAKVAVATQKTDLDASTVLTYVRNNGGMKGEAIAAEFGTDTATLRGVLKQLAAAGAIKSEGDGRGTVYLATGKRAVASAS